MSWNSVPLTGGQLTKVRSGNYAGDYLLTLCKNRVVFAGQVNSDLTTPTSWAQFNYNNVTTGAYTDVEVDQVILVAATNDKTKATFRGRIRKAPTSGIIYTNEASDDFAVGAYWWVIDSYDATYKLSRPSTTDPATAVELVDYDLTYAPPAAVVVGLRMAYVDNVDASSGKMRVAFNVGSSYAVASGDSITAYQFTFKASSYTVISGALNTSAVTVDFDPGEQWGKLVVTTANGQTKTRHFYIFAHDANNPPDTGFADDQLTISGDLSRGWTMTTEAFTGIDSVLPNTFAVCWRTNENYGGVAGGLDSTNNIAFVGWLQREDDTAASDPTFSVLETARLEFTGFGPRLARLTAQLLPFTNVSAASNWGEIVHLTPWRAICHFLHRYTTALNLADLTFDDTSNGFEFPALSSQGGNAWTAVSGICDQINAVFETASDGRLQVCRSAEYLSQAARNALTEYIDYTSQDVVGEATRSLEHNKLVGIVDGDGAYYNLATAQISVFTVRAPGMAQGEAQGRDTLSNQILTVTTSDATALTELRQRAGNRYEVANNTETLSVMHMDGLTGLQPSRSMLYTFTLDALDANGVNRISLTTATLWMLESVSYGRGGNGTTGVRANYRKLPRIGDPGDNTTQVAANSVDDSLPDLGFPAFNWELPELTFPDVGLDSVNPAQLAPPPGQITATNGQSLLVASTTQAFWLTNVISLKKPTARDVTPSDLGSYTIQAVAISPFYTKTAVPAWILAYDSGNDNSAVWSTPNVAATVPTWTKGADTSGHYQVLRATSVDGTIIIYSPSATSGTTWSHTFDFTLSDYGWAPVISNLGGTDYTRAAYVAGQGWHRNYTVGNYNDRVSIYLNHATYTLTDETVTLNDGTGVSSIGMFGPATVYPAPTGNSASYTGSLSETQEIVDVVFNSANDPYITSVLLQGTGANPYGGNGDAQAVASTDNGATWGTVRNCGVTPGAVGGFDVQPAGSVSYCAAAGKVRKATTLGGAPSDWFAVPSSANPVVIIIPWYRRNSTTRNTAVSDPDVIIGCDNGLWYWIDGTAATSTTITPVTNILPGNPDCLTVRYGNLLAAWGTVVGVQKLYTSSDGGGSWTLRSTITSGGKIRCRRQDARLSPNGQIYLCQNNVIDYSSQWFSNALYPRTMPVTGITMMDTVF